MRVLQFRGFVTMPAAGSTTTTVSAPFSITGTVSYTPDGGRTHFLNYLAGGQVTVHLTYDAEYNVWYTESAEFTISRP